MPEVRRRRVAEDKPVTRRRDRARAEEVEEDEEEETPRRPRKAAGATKKTTRRRPPEPEPEEDEEEEVEEDEEEYEEDEEEEDEEEESPPPRRKKAAATKKAAPRRTARRRPVEEDEDEEEEAPRRPKKAVAKKTAARSTKKRASSKLPQGLHAGVDGAEAVVKSGGGGVTRLTLTKEPELIKVLENGPFVSFKQHWIPMGGGQGDRPYTCLERDCPLCDGGDARPGKVFVFNILHLSTDEGEPVNKILQMGVTAYEAFKSAATPRGKEKPLFERDYWAVSRSGKNRKSQTNFQPMKDRDLEEDWSEIFEEFDIDDLPAIVEEAQENVFDISIIQTHTAKQLRDVARHLTEDDEEDDEDDDE